MSGDSSRTRKIVDQAKRGFQGGGVDAGLTGGRKKKGEFTGFTRERISTTLGPP